uniref:Uncharacterized protein n=1 Tax=Glossina pallidipes TaxID=7398 RepID=A0A1B0A4I4_GLOPL
MHVYNTGFVEQFVKIIRETSVNSTQTDVSSYLSPLTNDEGFILRYSVTNGESFTSSNENEERQPSGIRSKINCVNVLSVDKELFCLSLPCLGLAAAITIPKF